jgi:hypothetical protein
LGFLPRFFVGAFGSVAAVFLGLDAFFGAVVSSAEEGSSGSTEVEGGASDEGSTEGKGSSHDALGLRDRFFVFVTTTAGSSTAAGSATAITGSTTTAAVAVFLTRGGITKKTQQM